MDKLDLLRLSLSLVAVIVLILASAWLARRSGLLRNRGQAAIAVIASQSLGGRNSVVVIEVEQQRLVLGITQHQINLLHTLPSDLPNKDDAPCFDDTLLQAMHQKKQSTPPQPTESADHSEENNIS